MDVVWLGEPACHDLSLVGGKAAQLSRLASAGYRVPPGFCLTTDFIERGGRGGLGRDDDATEHPALSALFDEFSNAHHRLAELCGVPNPAVAVRSSAVEEDAPSTSFAGVHDTYLNIRGEESIARAIRRCSASARSPRALEYCRQRGIHADRMRLAVLVQQLIPADVSAVLFSADPVRGRSEEIVINANWGLGDSIAGGRVTPDTYVVNKHTMTLLSRHIANKGVVTIAGLEGARDVLVPRLLRKQPVLDEADAIELARLAAALEAHMGCHVDVECAYCGGELYVLQCRPLTGLRSATTITPVQSAPMEPRTASAIQTAPEPIEPPSEFPVTWEPPEDARLFWFINRMHTPDPIPVLGYEFGRHCYEHGINLQAAVYGWRINSRTRRINTYLYWNITPDVMSDEELEAQNELSQELLDAALGRLGELWRDEVLPEVQHYLHRWETFDLLGASMPELRVHLERTVVWSKRLYELHFVIVWPMIAALGAFDDLWEDLFSDEGALGKYRLLEGFDNKSLETDRALWQLSRLARATADVRAALMTRDTGAILRALEQTVEGRVFLVELRAFLDRYGHRGKVFLVSDPNWIDDPTPVLTNLREYVDQPDRDVDGERLARAQERDRRVQEVRRTLEEYPTPLAQKFDVYLKAAQDGSVLQENHNYWIDQRGMYQVRRVLVEFGRRFAAAGVLGHPEDVFHLTLDELRETATALPVIDRRQLVLARKAEIERFRSVSPPPALGATPPGPARDTPLGRAVDKFFGVPLPPPSEPHVVQGYPGSPGLARGRARVVRSLTEADRVQKGDILIAEATMPTWTPLFATVAAVVTDVGGVTSHCAIVAREYGIPAVVGTTVATSFFKDGQLVEVDGDAGIARLLRPADPLSL